MPYTKQTDDMLQFLKDLEEPKILEIGLFTGTTAQDLCLKLIHNEINFDFLGIDVLIRDKMRGVEKLILEKGGNIRLLEANSLDALEDLDEVFDLVLIDGDHNYYTVSRELAHLDRITRVGSEVYIDDYGTKWSKKDMFYASRPAYKDVEIATQPQETQLHGVRPAVDEFLRNNPHWKVKSSKQVIVLERKA